VTPGPLFLEGPAATLAAGPGHRPGPPRATLLCDRDGTIIANRAGYVLDVSHTVPLAGATTALRRAARAGFLIVIVSNQSPVGRGLLTQAQAIDVHRALLRRLALAGVPVAGSYLCPHRPDDGCPCRKPRPGMIEAALGGFLSDRHRSVMLGDAVEDMQAARAAGLEGVLVRTGRGGAHARVLTARPELRDIPVVADLGAAVDRACALSTPPGAGSARSACRP
jgi:D-glycero-D-manno-heptose 1,7-bisphosphate phosphatase